MADYSEVMSHDGSSANTITKTLDRLGSMLEVAIDEANKLNQKLEYILRNSSDMVPDKSLLSSVSTNESPLHMALQNRCDDVQRLTNILRELNGRADL